MNALGYLNPIERFGNKKRSYLFPLLTTSIIVILLDIIFVIILKNPSAIGIPAITLSIALVIYFAFRDGIIGGLISVCISVFFYIYLIFSLQYKNQQLIAGVETTIILGIIYVILALVIGGLKQTIDNLIEREADGRRRLEAIVEQLPVGVIITDSKGIIIQANKQADTILGIKTPIGFIAGSQNLVPSTYKGKPLNPSQTPLLHVLQTGKSIVGKEYILERNDGKKIALQVSAAPVTNSKKKIIASALIFNDVTLQKEHEERKDDFVNMASHELKTPLTTMKIYSDLLIKQTKKYDTQDRKIMQNIKLQIQRLQQIVNDLLDVSRLQTGKLSLLKERFYLDELLENICEDLQPSTKQQLKIVRKIRQPIIADKFRIYQVLTNIITNAIKYSPKTTKIYIRLERKNKNTIISVEDFGIGIAKSQQKKIFEKLYQVREIKGETYPGFGMGLYISKEIIQRHKGKIWVTSTLGKGTIFSFSLPLPKN